MRPSREGLDDVEIREKVWIHRMTKKLSQLDSGNSGVGEITRVQ